MYVKGGQDHGREKCKQVMGRRGLYTRTEKQKSGSVANRLGIKGGIVQTTWLIQFCELGSN